ncbi:MAG: hypothetical protein IH614_12715 [Desulfuromonadales bacterium]|nr:hypothetical protein [Desulfuromonadales bacterium]
MQYNKEGQKEEGTVAFPDHCNPPRHMTRGPVLLPPRQAMIKIGEIREKQYVHQGEPYRLALMRH